MKAITVEPRKPGTARLEDDPEPEVRDFARLLERKPDDIKTVVQFAEA